MSLTHEAELTLDHENIPSYRCLEKVAGKGGIKSTQKVMVHKHSHKRGKTRNI
jgi:hypothetical protein